VYGNLSLGQGGWIGRPLPIYPGVLD
jgi:hypothetical protein